MEVFCAHKETVVETCVYYNSLDDVIDCVMSAPESFTRYYTSPESHLSPISVKSAGKHVS